MPFSPFVWKLYIASEEGRSAMARDLAEHAAAFSPVPRTPPFDFALCSAPLENGEVSGPVAQGENSTVDLRSLFRTEYAEHTVSSLEEAERLFSSIADEGLEWRVDLGEEKRVLVYGGGEEDVLAYEDIILSIQGLSSGMHEAFPEFFFPYLFSCSFDRLQRIGDRFGISLPEIPGRRKVRDRALYYLQVNREMQRFRREHGLSPAELNAFLYDFAEKEMGKQESGQLPRPSKIWFLMGGAGGNGDFEFLDATDERSLSYWQASLEARRGDLALVWCVSPRSSLHSIWRVLDDGFNDPYFFFYTAVRIGRPVRMPPISFKEIASHPSLAKAPSVRAHFQGCSGMSFSVEEYSAILEMIRAKGFDLSVLPDAPEAQPLPDVELFCERDVESALVEPLLRRVGFSEADWIYQYRIRMGRGERNVPDYVVGTEGGEGEESAVVLIESKFDIPDSKKRKDAFLQGRSYALRLQCVVMMLAALQGVWIYKRVESGFDADRYVFYTWRELETPDVFAGVKLLIGKDAVDKELKVRRRQKTAQSKR
jgi:hypothetical protein